MKTIPLTQGKLALVGDEDYEDLSQYKWQAHRRRNKTFYAVRHIRIGKKRLTEQMHRKILDLKPGDGKYADHKDCNGLNNQRSNLRVATRMENQRNRTKQDNNTSGYKGVSWYKRDKKWQAQIQVNSQQKHLGLFDSRTEAALVYNLAAVKYFGRFARLNQINIEVKATKQ